MAGRLVLLTGATGFIGSRLARRLAERGDRLRCWARGARASAGTEELERLGAEVVRGELGDVDGLARALAGVDLAYHLAAIYDFGVVDAGAMERVNVGGTRAFLEAIERARTPRAVYVSTTVALGPVAVGSGDEATEHGPEMLSAYERTKVEAHRLARAAQDRGVPLVIVCPANVYGPGDHGPNGRFLAALLRGRVPGLPMGPSWFSYVHVDDVVDGLVRAGLEGRAGATYVLSGEERSLNDFSRAAAELAGRRAPFLRFPAQAVRLTGMAYDFLTRVTGRRFPISGEMAAMAAGKRWLHSHERATRELGWTPRPLAQGLPETVAWLLSAGS
jgi:dihydroflavonol-4-reductase